MYAVLGLAKIKSNQITCKSTNNYYKIIEQFLYRYYFHNMNHATLDDFEKIYSYYQKYKVWFPHVRTDKLKKVIEEGRCIYEDEVVLHNIYKRRTRVSNNSKVYAERGEGIIHQMISSERGKGTPKVFEEFFKMIDTNLYLSVRTSNHKVISFYNKMGMRQVGKPLGLMER